MYSFLQDYTLDELLLQKFEKLVGMRKKFWFILFFIILIIIIISITIFDKQKFYNIESFDKKNFIDVLHWRITRKDANWPKYVKNNPYNFDNKKNCKKDICITYINHSTVLIEHKNLKILTDPIWSKTAFKYDWAGPKRIREPGIDFSSLPNINLVLISHNHYDHMDLKTIKKIEEKFHPLFVVGLENKPYLQKIGVKNIVELGWWDSVNFKGTNIFYVPAQHFSARGLFDYNSALWGGFIINTKLGNIYFAGDTAMAKHFKLINKKFSPIIISILPIGTYEPRNFMKSSHINPDEAVKAFIDLKSKWAIGVHFGTFSNLSDEKHSQPINDLKNALKKHKIPHNRFFIIDFGQTCKFNRSSFTCNKPL